MGRPGVLPAGSWLCHDTNAFELALLAEKGTATIDYREPGHSNQFMRSGALGDLLLLTPALKAYKEAGGTPELHCFKQHWPLFEGTDLVNLFEYPVPLSKYSSPHIQDLQNHELNQLLHMTDSFAEALGVTVTDYKPVYVVRDDEKEAGAKVRTSKRPLLGVQMRSSTENRNYPPQQWLEVIVKLEQRGWEIVLFGAKGQIAPLPPRFRTPFIHNLAERDLTFRQSAGVLANCDAFVGIDSVWIHMCHALDIPAIGLYGPFPHEIRTSKAPLTQVIQGFGDCAPCHYHAHAGRHFPAGKPCSTVGRCVVLADIAVDRIVRKVDSLRPKHA